MHVLIVDDHTIIRRGIRNLLTQRYPDVRVSDAGSIRETRKILNSEQPCLMILDLLLSDGNAMDHLDEWRELRPGTKVLVYSMTSEMLYARRVIGLGCSGFLSKDTPEEELIKAINTRLRRWSSPSRRTDELPPRRPRCRERGACGGGLRHARGSEA